MAQALQLTGKYLGTMKIQTVGQNEMKIRKFYIDITDNPQYPNTPEIQLKGDNVYLVDNIQIGQTIVVSFNIDGRKYTNQQGKPGVITNLTAWKIEILQRSTAVNSQPQQPAPAPAPQHQARPQQAGPRQAAPNPFPFAGTDDDNDLPF